MAQEKQEKEPEKIDAYMGTMELYQRIYDFILYIYPILAQFPKFEKFALQTQIKTAVFEMLKDVIRFKKTGTKSHIYAAFQVPAFIASIIPFILPPIVTV